MSFRVLIDAQVERALGQLPRAERVWLEERLEQTLGELALLAALRRWAILSEEGERMPLEVRTRHRYMGFYSVSYKAGALTLHSLRLHAAELPEGRNEVAGPEAAHAPAASTREAEPKLRLVSLGGDALRQAGGRRRRP